MMRIALLALMACAAISQPIVQEKITEHKPVVTDVTSPAEYISEDQAHAYIKNYMIEGGMGHHIEKLNLDRSQSPQSAHIWLGGKNGYQYLGNSVSMPKTYATVKYSQQSAVLPGAQHQVVAQPQVFVQPQVIAQPAIVAQPAVAVEENFASGAVDVPVVDNVKTGSHLSAVKTAAVAQPAQATIVSQPASATFVSQPSSAAWISQPAAATFEYANAGPAAFTVGAPTVEYVNNAAALAKYQKVISSVRRPVSTSYEIHRAPKVQVISDNPIHTSSVIAHPAAPTHMKAEHYVSAPVVNTWVAGNGGAEAEAALGSLSEISLEKDLGLAGSNFETVEQVKLNKK